MPWNEENLTMTGSWRAWKKACAVDLCDQSTAKELKRFGRFAFQSQAKKYSTVGLTDVDDAWHLLETYSRVRTDRKGKRYKDWLFYRAPDGDQWLNAVEAGAVLLMRDVVRELLRREYTPSFMTSMNKPVGDSGCTLEDLLPDSGDGGSDVEQRERQALASDCAVEVCPKLEFRERVALWARANGFSLSDPRVLKWTKSTRSVLYDTHRKAVEKICDAVKSRCPDESPSEQLSLSRTTLETLNEMIASKIIQEKRAARFFKQV